MGRSSDPLSLLSPKAQEAWRRLEGTANDDTDPTAAPLDQAINKAMQPKLSDAAKTQSLANARAAIAAGKDRNAVIQKLQAAGIDPSGL